MNPNKLDHVALLTADRDELGDFLCSNLDMHVIERTEAFTLVGASATAGKLTLFQAPPGVVPRPKRLVSVTLADNDGPAREPLTAPGGLVLTFAEHVGSDRHAVVGITLRVEDPVASAAAYAATFGFGARTVHPNVATLTVGEAAVTLVREETPGVEVQVIHHLGLLVDSAQEQIESATELGLSIVDIKDTANTYAVFVEGPDDVRLEFVEHKPEFALS